MEETKLSKDLLLLIGLKIYKDKDIVHVDDKDFEKVVKVELELQWDKKLRESEKVVANIIIIESFLKEIKLKEYPGRTAKRHYRKSVRSRSRHEKTSRPKLRILNVSIADFGVSDINII